MFGGSVAWDSQLITKAVRQVIPVCNTRLCVVDCRMLWQPAADSRRIHSGVHPANFKPIVSSANFHSVIRPASHFLLQAFYERATDSSPLTLVFLDFFGRHQCVAVARVAAEICRRYPMFRLGSVQDLTPMSRSPLSCSECDGCVFFAGWWKGQNEALNEAVKSWGESSNSLKA